MTTLEEQELYDERFYNMTCDQCEGTSEWNYDFTVKNTEYVIHRCTKCGRKTKTEWPKK